MKYSRIFLWLLISLLSFCTYGESAKNKIPQINDDYLMAQLMNNHFGLDCQTTDPTVDCDLMNEGKMITLYYILNALDDDNVAKIKRRAITEVKAERRNQQWGYSFFSLIDADDTSYAMQILSRFGEQQNAEALFGFYKPQFRAYTTFMSKFNVGLVTHPTEPNNFGIFPEVNANVSHLFYTLKLESIINYDLIHQAQNQAGYWNTYNYAGKYYSTYMNMKVLCETKRNKDDVLRGIHFLKGEQLKDGSWSHDSYDTALALNALLACGYAKDTSVKTGIQYLLNAKIKNGLWKTDQIIWMYLFREKPEVKWTGHDNYHVFTTAFALMALKKYFNEQKAIDGVQ